jgi:hypothetical protein
MVCHSSVGPGSPYSLVGETEAADFNEINAEERNEWPEAPKSSRLYILAVFQRNPRRAAAAIGTAVSGTSPRD